MKTDYILSKEYLNSLFYYKDGDLYWKMTKGRILKDTVAGTKSHHYHQICIDYKIYRTHRLVWIFHNGNTDQIIDHINNNSYDNRIENLRVCTLSQNVHNSKRFKNNTSGVKGVGWCIQKNKWRARLILDKKEIHVGFFDNLEDAKNKITEQRKLLHKEFYNHG
jgi:hypothetical protein